MSEQRRPIRDKDAKHILNAFAEQFPSSRDLFKNRKKIEMAVLKNITVLWIDDTPLVIKLNEEYYPTLNFSEVIATLPKIVVDMGAVPHVVNGADIMSPGIRNIQGEFAENSIVLIVDEKFGKPLAIGKALLSSNAMKTTKHGKVITNLHYVGDPVWNSAKTG